MRHRRDVGDHVCGVATVTGHAADFVHILADKRIVASALATITARAAKPAHARSRPHLPAVDALAKRVDDADHLMPRHARILDDRKETLDTVTTSLWQTPQAWTRRRISSGPGTGMSLSSVTNRPPRSRTPLRAS